jgi:hypothetical protein
MQTGAECIDVQRYYAEVQSAEMCIDMQRCRGVVVQSCRGRCEEMMRCRGRFQGCV